MTLRKLSTKHTRIDAHMNSDCGSIHRAYDRFKPNGIPALKGGSRHWVAEKFLRHVAMWHCVSMERLGVYSRLHNLFLSVLDFAEI